ncbi:1-phosphatidylinositol 4,5-bisphosphate phosphodiesterase zeta-1-like [Actinia tenebrosa]|uniref:Phosphoinositide phospholipase C n=1 Tax=Actinia tenebrosa TaxID=6105 RepID=A0A6P8HYI5_ACTTE|nr:1-phosphatidylinositol 4,5-bisphosphate phosphodiesterase zeta-1-like [Actinia tenebrosa]
MAETSVDTGSRSTGIDLWTSRPSIQHGGVDLKSVIKAGYLCGLSSSKSKYYVLTKSSLDSYKNRHCDKLKGSVPLVAMETIEICVHSNRSLQITGPYEHPIILQALSRDEAQEWKRAIEEGICHWRLDSEQDCSNPKIQSREMKTPNKALTDMESKLMMYPSLKRAFDQSPTSDLVFFSAASEVHHEFAMIKYARAGKAIPHEKLVKLDNDNLHIMWKKRSKHSFSFRNTLALNKVVEVRCGQQTKNFNKFPYTEVENQSFSLIFEKEQGEWGQLVSLDLICDSLKAFDKWHSALKEIIYSKDARLNRQKYGGIDPVVLWLKRHWSVLISKRSKSIAADQVLTFANHCWPEGNNKKLLKNHIRNVLETQCGVSHAEERLVWNSFLLLFDSLNEQARLFGVYARYARSFPHLGMTPEEFKEFLMKEQKEYLSVDVCSRLIYFHDKVHTMFKRKCAGNDPDDYKRSKHFLSYHGFISYIRSGDNSVVNPEHNTVHQDMDQPLSDYFINSSHNTYLTGHQFRGQSSLEAYVRALLLGCRCIELDCWDGPDEPIITHGYTPTSRIRFRDVVQVIREYAFETSDYPVILSLENHCSQQQQAIMADIFMNELGDMLATNNLCVERKENKLPSPNDLKRKIILKGKIKLKKKSRALAKFSVGAMNVQNVSPKQRKISKTAVWHSQSVSQLTTTVSAQSLNVMASSPTSLTGDKLDVSNISNQQEEVFNTVLLEGAMDKLIVYCRALPYKKNDVSDDCCQMYSFSESTIYDLVSANPREMVSLSKRHLVRAYPKVSRVDSSNYDPQWAWNAGVQLVALNFQKPDSGMHLNQGKFRKNGGCGYILKPDALRNNNQNRSGYHPMITASPIGGKSCYFTFEVLSGQYLHIDDGCRLPVRVEIDTVGIPADCATFATEVRYERLNPQWSNTKHMFNVAMPELCLVYFKVLTVIQRNKTKLLFQNVISLDSIRQGIRYIQLRTPTGVLTSHSGLFVKIRLQQFQQASYQVKGTSRERLLTI